MAEHTPEPWLLETKDGVHRIMATPKGQETAAVAFQCVYGRGQGHQKFMDECKANARRIVACVNACQGIETEVLEGHSIQREWEASRTLVEAAEYRAEAAERLLRGLASAEQEYRSGHDHHGDGPMRAGRAWDRMRRAGDEARAHLEGTDR